MSARILWAFMVYCEILNSCSNSTIASIENLTRVRLCTPKPNPFAPKSLLGIGVMNAAYLLVQCILKGKEKGRCYARRPHPIWNWPHGCKISFNNNKIFHQQGEWDHIWLNTIYNWLSYKYNLKQKHQMRLDHIEYKLDSSITGNWEFNLHCTSQLTGVDKFSVVSFRLLQDP